MRVQIDEVYPGELGEKAEALADRIAKAARPRDVRLREPTLRAAAERANAAYRRMLADLHARIDEVVGRRPS